MVSNLEQLDYDQLDAEQQFRVRRIVASVRGRVATDTPDQIAEMLFPDPLIWLALLDRPEKATRTAAVKQLAALLDESIDIDPAAEPATQRKQREQLRRKIVGRRAAPKDAAWPKGAALDRLPNLGRAVRRMAHDLVHCFAIFRSSRAASCGSEARTAANVGLTPGRGISTRSRPGGNCPRLRRNASRSSRRHRFRTAAPPVFARPTGRAGDAAARWARRRPPKSRRRPSSGDDKRVGNRRRGGCDVCEGNAASAMFVLPRPRRGPCFREATPSGGGGLSPPQVAAGVLRITLVELPQELAIGLVHLLRHHDLRLGKQVARRAAGRGHPVPLDAELRPRGGPGGMVSVTAPVGVGTSIFAPSAASPSVNGSRT